jgi:K+/H+ antiporter YhaU regulatory subunit KhtT
VTVRTIVSLVIALLKLANSIYGWLHDSALIKEGEDRQVAKALAEMAARSTTLREIESRFSKMTPEQVSRELEQDFRPD